MKTRMVMVLAVLCAAGCATTPSNKAAQVIEADEKMVAECDFLGSVEGWDGWGGLGAKGAMKRAKNEAREKASDMGATHVVFTSVYGGYGGSAAARAYRCR